MASRTAPPASSQGRATSCTACRQVKLKCDARETFPAPCSRCVAKKFACRMDSNFRRMPVRKRLEEATKQLSKYEELLGRDVQPGGLPAVVGSSLGDARISGPATVNAVASSVTGGSPTSSAAAMNLLLSGVCFAPDSDDVPQQPEHYVLGDNLLSRQAAFDIFHEFQCWYYQHFPVLDTSKTRDEMYEQSPLLFWTIVITASEHCAGHSYLYSTLHPAYESLLAMNIVKVTRSVAQIQAILILVNWPLPYPGPTHDPSWGYCGLAMNAALQMGMHRPGFHREYGYPDLNQEQVQLRTVTWMMAFQTSVCLSTYLGLPPFIDATPHMDAILANPSGLPKVIVAQTDIQLHMARFTKALDDHTMEPAAKAMYIGMFERDLDRLRGTLESTWSSNVELNLLSAKMYLYSHMFITRKHRGSDVAIQNARSPLEDPASRKIIYSGLTTAVSYIHAFTDMIQPRPESPMSLAASPENQPELISQFLYTPHHYGRAFVLCVFYLLKFLALGPDVPEAEQELARNHVTIAYNTFKAYPNSVETAAVAQTIELLVKTGGIQAEGKVATRLGASIIYDSLLTFGQLQKAKSAGKLDPLVQPEVATPLMVSVAPTPGSDAFYGDGFSLAEFLDTDWNLPWDTNFFDIGGMGMRDR